MVRLWAWVGERMVADVAYCNGLLARGDGGRGMAGWWSANGRLGWALAVSAALSCVGFLLHAVDKRRARRHGRRVPESWLHLVEVAGGWPGALVAMRLFRHKTRKVRYRVVFVAMVVMHVAAVVVWVGRFVG